MSQTDDFISALKRHVAASLRESGEAADYCNRAVEITDARNHLFRDAGTRGTDEAENVYALRDLCRLDEDTMELLPDEGRLRSVARNFGL